MWWIPCGTLWAPSKVSGSTKLPTRTAGKAEHNSPFPGFAHTPCLFCLWALECLKRKQSDRSFCSCMALDGPEVTCYPGKIAKAPAGRWLRGHTEGSYPVITFCLTFVWSCLEAALTLGVDDHWGAEDRCPLSFLGLCEQLLMPWTSGAVPTDLQCGTLSAPQWLWTLCPEEQADPSCGKAREGDSAPDNS